MKVEILDKDGNFHKSADTLVVPKISDLTPSRPFDISNLCLLENLTYANPNFFKPQCIQILPGSDVFYELLLIGQIKLQNNSVIFQNTRLQWTVVGTLNDKDNDTKGQDSQSPLATWRLSF